MCAYANLFLNDRDAAEDMVQEVFFNLWKNRAAVTFDRSVKSYLFRAVRNRCLNLIEHIRIREGYKIYNQANRTHSEQQFIDESVVSELEQKIRNTIDQLPVERRKIFMMSRFEGLKYREIADELGISVKTVENQMSHALAFLRDHLKEYLTLIWGYVAFWLSL